MDEAAELAQGIIDGLPRMALLGLVAIDIGYGDQLAAVGVGTRHRAVIRGFGFAAPQEGTRRSSWVMTERGKLLMKVARRSVRVTIATLEARVRRLCHRTPETVATEGDTVRSSVLAQLLSRYPEGLPVLELAVHTHADRTAVYRALQQLRDLGMVVQQKETVRHSMGIGHVRGLWFAVSGESRPPRDDTRTESPGTDLREH